MLLAGDLGGTKTLLGLFQRATRRPTAVTIAAFRTNEFSSFTEILDAFTREVGHQTIDAAAIGVAGPVLNRRAQLTNVTFSSA